MSIRQFRTYLRSKGISKRTSGWALSCVDDTDGIISELWFDSVNRIRFTITKRVVTLLS